MDESVTPRLIVEQPVASFLSRVRDAVARLRRSAIPNDDLTTVIAEIEALNALLPSLGDTSDFQSGRERDLPSLTFSSPYAESLDTTFTPRALTPSFTNDWRGLFSDPEPSLGPSNTVNPRDLVRYTDITVTTSHEHSSLTALSGVNNVEVFGQECELNPIQYPQLGDATSDREVTAQMGREHNE